MNFKKQNFIISFALFGTINLLFLFSDLSLAGLISTMLTLLYYFLRIGCRKRSSFSLRSWLSAYLGGLMANVYCLFLIKNQIFDSFGDRLTEWLKNPFSNHIFIAIPLLAFIFLFCLCISKKGIVLDVFRYAAVAGFYILSVESFDRFFLLPIIVIVLISAMVSITSDQSDEPHGIIIIRWLSLITVTFGILYNMGIPAFRNMIATLYHFRALLHIPSYITILTLLLLASGCIFFVFQRINSCNTPRESVQDTGIYLSLFFAIELFHQICSSATAADFIFAFCLAIAILVFVTFSKKEKMFTFHVTVPKVESSLSISFSKRNLLCLGIFSFISILQYSLYVGILMDVLILTFGIVFIFLYCYRYQKNLTVQFIWERIPWRDWGFWQILLSVSFVYAIYRAWFSCHAASEYYLLVSLYILITFTLFCIREHEKKSTVEGLVREIDCYARIAVSTLAIITLLVTSNQTHVSIQFSESNTPDSGKRICVCVEDNTRDTKIVRRTLYWLSDPDSAMDSDNINTFLPYRNGCLCVEAEDSKGVIIRDYHWFYDAEFDTVEWEITAP